MLVVVTGTSSGIGKAITQKYLTKGARVIGIGRRHFITHDNYTAVTCDLSDARAIRNLPVNDWINEDVLLINNAGILGEVKRVSDQTTDSLEAVMAINTVAPELLMQRFAQACGDTFPLTVVNISSGAAKRAIPSWAAYCASKAALEMFSQTFYLEEQEKGRTTKVYAVAPGVVDTAMQEHIRNVRPEDFSAVEQFISYYEKEELVSPELVADKLFRLLELPFGGEIIYSLRDID